MIILQKTELKLHKQYESSNFGIGIAFCWPLLVKFITERAFVGFFWLSLSQKELLLALFG
jgi:hypothetical protein